MDTETLLGRARQGDRQTWNLLLERVRPLVRAFLRFRLRQDADASELANVALLHADRGFAAFRGETGGQFLVWLRRIAANVFRDHLRRLRLPLVSLQVDLPEDEETPAWEEDWEQVLLALDRLPRHRRDVVEARFLAGLPSAEVARRLGRTDTWVRVTCLRAVEQLRRILQREES